MLKNFQKLLKGIAIALVSIVVIIVIAGIALPYFLPLDKIKGIVAEKASQAIHREVKIGKVSFNIFTGIQINDLSVSNRPGFSKEPFVSAGLIELKYDFWALLRGKVAVDKVVLIKPEILIETRDGVSNYSDLVGVKKPVQPKKAESTAKKKESISIMVSKFAIKNGKLTLKQEAKVTQLKDLNVNVSNITLNTKKPIELAVSVMGVYEGKSVPISVDGNIFLNLDRSYAKISNLDISAAGEKLRINAEVSSFDKAPSVKLNLSSGGIDTDKFMAIVSGTGTKKKKVVPPYGQMTANINKSLKSIPSNLKLDANVDMRNILFKEMKLNAVAGKVTMSNKVVNIILNGGIKAYKGTITGNIIADLNLSGIGYTVKDIVAKGFDATPASNDIIESFLTKLPDYKDLKDKIYGDLSFGLSMTGRGVETVDIIANAKGKGNFLLANGKVSKLKSLSAIGEKIGLKTLQEDIELKEFKANFSFADKVATISNMALHNGDAGDVKLTFNGSANISTLAFIGGNRMSLKLNPKTTALSSEYDTLKDAKGWYSLDFEMTGSLKRPIPIPRVDKAAQQYLDTKKKEAEGALQKEVDRKKQEVEDKAKQELENKAKEMFKF